MSGSERQATSPEAAPKSGCLGIVARLWWMVAGNAAVAVFAALIATSPMTFSWRDLAYFLVVVSLVAVRYADVTMMGGTTADGAPATRAHWRRYAAVLTIVCLGIWAAAHTVALYKGS